MGEGGRGGGEGGKFVGVGEEERRGGPGRGGRVGGGQLRPTQLQLTHSFASLRICIRVM